MLTRICVEPHPSTISQTGRLRYGRASLELTGRRMSASPCWPSPAHPRWMRERESGGGWLKKVFKFYLYHLPKGPNPNCKWITGSPSFTSYFPPSTHFAALQPGQWEEGAKNICSPLRSCLHPEMQSEKEQKLQ